MQGQAQTARVERFTRGKIPRSAARRMERVAVDRDIVNLATNFGVEQTLHDGRAAHSERRKVDRHHVEMIGRALTRLRRLDRNDMVEAVE